MPGLDVSTAAWGPLARPARTEPPTVDLPYRDNSYMGFWDVGHRVVGAAHVSTSPIDVPNRKISFTVLKDGRRIELLDTPEPGRMSTKEISIDLSGLVTVDHPNLRAELRMTPRLPVADYGSVLPALPGVEPPAHYQGGADMSGWIEIDGSRTILTGGAYRDRTSGYRNDVEQFPEYVMCMALFEDLSISVIAMNKPDGTAGFTHGFAMTATGTEPITRLAMTRTGAGLFHALALEVGEDRGRLVLADAGKLGTIWIPLGPPTDGAALEIMEEFGEFRLADGRRGAGLVEQGIARRVGARDHA